MGRESRYDRSRISTHALRMEGDHWNMDQTKQVMISTHALRMEGDNPPPASEFEQALFLPTPSAWRATYNLIGYKGDTFISTHALRMEGDSKHAEVQACISAAYLKCSTRKAAASSRRAGLGGRVVLFHQLSRLVLGRARCEPRGEGMCDRGSHRQSGRRKGLKTHSSKMSSWLH